MNSPHSTWSDRLWQARLDRKPIPPVTDSEPSITVEDAYRISRANFDKRISLPGVRAIGRKIGLTSRAVQAQLKVSEPDYGYLTSDMNLPDQGVLPANTLIQGKVEGEVAFLLGRDLRGENLSLKDIENATDSVMACIEIVDCRIADWKIKIEDTIADNAASAFIVLSSERKKLASLDLRMAGMGLWLNGEVESSGAGGACLDHPVNAVLWLARKMVSLGHPLEAGDIILSGAYGPLVPFKEGDRCEVAISGLGKVGCRYGN